MYINYINKKNSEKKLLNIFKELSIGLKIFKDYEIQLHPFEAWIKEKQLLIKRYYVDVFGNRKNELDVTRCVFVFTFQRRSCPLRREFKILRDLFLLIKVL